MRNYNVPDCLRKIDRTSGITIEGNFIKAKPDTHIGNKKWGMIDFIKKNSPYRFMWLKA